MNFNADRFQFGPDAKCIYSISHDLRKETAVVGSYKAQVFSALTNCSLPKTPSLMHALPAENETLEKNSATIIQQLKKRMALDPFRVLDLPDVPNCLFRQSISLHNEKIAVLLNSACYIVTKPTSPVYSTYEAFKSKDVVLRAVAWINDTTLALGTAGTEEVYLVNLLKPNHIISVSHNTFSKQSSVTKITRLSDTAFLTGYTCGRLLHNDMKGHTTKLLDSTNDAIIAILPSCDGRRLAVGFKSDVTKIFSLTFERALPALTLMQTLTGRTFQWQAGSNSNCITGSKKDRILRYYQLPSNNPTHSYQLSGAISSVVFLEKNLFIAACDTFIGYFCLSKMEILLIEANKVKERFLEAIYCQTIGLITSDADEKLSLFAPLALPKTTKMPKSTNWKISIR